MHGIRAREAARGAHDHEKPSSVWPSARCCFAAAASRHAAQSLPAYMAPIAGRTTATPSDTATKDMLALNTGMFELYDDASKIFQQNLLSKHPVILGLFSGAGGRFILYRPGMAPLEAPQVPIVYQLLKSVGPQHDGPGAGRRPLSGQSRRTNPGAARCLRIAAACSRHSTASMLTPMEADWRDQQSHHSAEQHRVHGRLPRQGHHPFRRARGFRQEAGPVSRAERGMGGADAGRPLDDGARWLEDACWAPIGTRPTRRATRST